MNMLCIGKGIIDGSSTLRYLFENSNDNDNGNHNNKNNYESEELDDVKKIKIIINGQFHWAN